MLEKAAIYFYVGIFASLVAAGLGAPIPEEFPIVTAGAFVGHASGERADRVVPALGAALGGSPDAGFPAGVPWPGLYELSTLDLPPALRWWIMLPVCILGVVISDALLYGMGRFWGWRLLNSRWMKRLVPPDRRERIESNFHNYGVLVLLFARFLPTIRSPIFIMAGIMRVSLIRFVIADGLYAIPGVSLLFFLAFWFGDQFRDLIYSAEGKVQSATRPILILAALAAVAAYLVWHFFRHPVATGDPREEIPVIGGQVTKIVRPPERAGQAAANEQVDKPSANTNHQPGAQVEQKVPPHL